MSKTNAITVLENGGSQEIAGSVDDSLVRLAAGPFLDLLGWTQKPEGLCRGEVCVPIGASPDLITSDGIDVVAAGELLGRPIATDAAESIVSVGNETESHGSELAEGLAPAFTLPDLTGKEYSLSSFKGKKVLLIAYASW